MKSILNKLVIGSICLLAISAPTAAVSLNNTPKILILNSYHENHKWTEGAVSAASRFLLSQTENIELYIEYMDTKRVYDTEYLQLIHQTLRLKYADVELDAIISTDDDALQYLLKHGNELFGQTPVVFCGVNNFQDSMLQGKTNFTGLVELIYIKPAIDLALKLHPETRKIAVLTDNTLTGLDYEKTIANVAERHKKTYENIKFEYISGKDLTTKELVIKLSKLSKDNVVLLANWSRDKTGRYYPDDSGAASYLVSYSSVAPIYELNDRWLGRGSTGGKLFSSGAHGRQAAKIALQILNGKSRPISPCASKSTITICSITSNSKDGKSARTICPKAAPSSTNRNHFTTSTKLEYGW